MREKGHNKDNHNGEGCKLVKLCLATSPARVHGAKRANVMVFSSASVTRTNYQHNRKWYKLVT